MPDFDREVDTRAGHSLDPNYIVDIYKVLRNDRVGWGGVGWGGVGWVGVDQGGAGQGRKGRRK